MSTCNIFSLILVLKQFTSLHSADVPPTFHQRSTDILTPFHHFAKLVTPTIKSNFVKCWDSESHFSSKPVVYLLFLVNFLKLLAPPTSTQEK